MHLCKKYSSKLLNEQLKTAQKFESAETKQFEQVVLVEIKTIKER
jgi:hypothetical protein